MIQTPFLCCTVFPKQKCGHVTLMNRTSHCPFIITAQSKTPEQDIQSFSQSVSLAPSTFAHPCFPLLHLFCVPEKAKVFIHCQASCHFHYKENPPASGWISCSPVVHLVNTISLWSRT